MFSSFSNVFSDWRLLVIYNHDLKLAMKWDLIIANETIAYSLHISKHVVGCKVWDDVPSGAETISGISKTKRSWNA